MQQHGGGAFLGPAPKESSCRPCPQACAGCGWHPATRVCLQPVSLQRALLLSSHSHTERESNLPSVTQLVSSRSDSTASALPPALRGLAASYPALGRGRGSTPALPGTRSLIWCLPAYTQKGDLDSTRDSSRTWGKAPPPPAAARLLPLSSRSSPPTWYCGGVAAAQCEGSSVGTGPVPSPSTHPPTRRLIRVDWSLRADEWHAWEGPQLGPGCRLQR